MKDRWAPLPLNEDAEIILIGKDGRGPYITDENNKPLLKKESVKDGYYILIDSNAEKEGSITDRPSINVSIGLYDCENRYLYYFRMDT